MHPIPIQFTYLPRKLLVVLAYIVEWIQWFTSGRGISGDLKSLTPAMTNLARISYILKSTKARDLLGYRPLFTVDDGVKFTSKIWCREQKAKGKQS